MKTIHELAVVGKRAEIGENVEIGPYSVIGNNVKIDDNTVISAHCVIDGNTQIGSNCFIGAYSSLGLPPQDIEYKGEDTQLIIGNKVTIREYCSLNKGTIKGGGKTTIGFGCYLMSYTHVGHDCHLHEEVIIANNTHLAGHVTVYRKANISSTFLAHQHIEVGELAIVSALSGSRKSIPPFVVAIGRPVRIARSVNLVGLERAGFSKETIQAIREAYDLIKKNETKIALAQIAQKVAQFPELQKIIDFYQNSSRGVIPFATVDDDLSA